MKLLFEKHVIRKYFNQFFEDFQLIPDT
jgi:hypothetical protein